MVGEDVLSTVGDKAGVFSAVEIGLGVGVGDAKTGADEVLVEGRVGVWVAPTAGACVDVGVRVFVGTGVSVGGGTGVDVGGAITVNVPSFKLSGTLFPEGSDAAVLPKVKFEGPELAFVFTLKMMFAMTPSGIAS